MTTDHPRHLRDRVDPAGHSAQEVFECRSPHRGQFAVEQPTQFASGTPGWPAVAPQPWFVLFAGAVLAITALAKSFSAIGPARALDAPDPLIGIPFRQLMLVVGLVELFVAFFCLFTEKQRFTLLAVAWLSTNFLVYRLGLWVIGWHHPCGCMGSLTGILHLSDRAADNIMKGVLAYLLIGSYGILFWQWRQRRTTPAPLKREEGALVT
jgi:hypothetical protein